MKMRKGFMLVEILVIIVTIPILMVFLAKLFNSLLTEVPRLWDNVQQNATMTNMLSQMQKDIDNATGLPQSLDGFTSDKKMLLIEQDNHIISYELSGEQVIRQILSGSQTNPDSKRIWTIPDAKIEWNVLRNDENGYAVEVQNYIEYPKGRRIEKKMSNSHIYFLGAL